MKIQYFYGVVGLFSGIVITLIFLQISQNQTGEYIGSAQGKNLRNSDSLNSHFIEQMIPHHEDAISMSELALTNAKRPEIKELAQSIINSQGKEITQMKEWYKEWFGRELPTGQEVMQHHGMGSNSSMHMGMTGDEGDLARLAESEDFDIAFIEHMIPHHQMAVMMASMLKDGTQREEMKNLADDIITSQTDEIEKMRQWLKVWKGSYVE